MGGSVYTGRSKKVTRRHLILLVVIISVVSTSTVLAGILLKPDSESNVRVALPISVEQEKTSSKKLVPGLPVRLVIAKLKVDAQINQVGLTEDGNMDIPSSIMETGWYKYGPHPGDTGSAVIAGHLERVGVEPGIFIDLEKLQRGDSLSIIDNKGQTIPFAVRELRYYDQYEKPSEVFNSNTGAHLNLITCAGTWNEAERRYSKRLVVFSDRSN